MTPVIERRGSRTYTHPVYTRLFLAALTLGLLALGCAPARPVSQVDVGAHLCMGHEGLPERGSAPWWRYVLLSGLANPDLAMEPASARRVAWRLERIGRLDRAADFLWQHAFHVLTPEQREYVADIQLPPGSCTCPCATSNPTVDKAVKTLKRRTAPTGEPLDLPETFPPDEPGIPPGMLILQGIIEMDGDPKLRLRPDQAWVLLQVVSVAGGALDTIEGDTKAIWKYLSREDRKWMATHGDAWLGGRTGTQLEGVWEQWHTNALTRMQAVGAGR